MGIKRKKSAAGTVTVDMTGYGVGGVGVARLSDGMVCFVEGALAGERCVVRLNKIGRFAAWGQVEHILIPSPERIASACVYDAHCGGCTLRHMRYTEELKFKAGRIRDCLTRIGGWEPGEIIVHGAKDTERYRNKVQFPISDSGIGFYAARTHAVTDVADCLLQPEVCGRLRGALKEFMRRRHVSAYDERTGTGLMRHLYVRTNRAGEALVCLLVNGKQIPHETELVETLRKASDPVRLRGVVLGVNETKSNVILGREYRTLWGQDFLMDTLCGFTFRLSIPSFYQVNAAQAEVLYERVMEFAGLTGKEVVLDLYCGIGTITLCLAQKAKRVIGAEVVPEAVADAKENAKRNGVGNVEFLCGDAAEIAADLAEKGVNPNVITVDPPRKGLSETAVDAIVRMMPERVVYVSCDPATLARDLARLREKGYQPVRAEGVDLFPRTGHVETVVLLSKLNAKQHIEVELNMDELDLTAAESKATYEEIKEYVLKHTGLEVSSLYIAQVKQKCGIIERENYNKPKSKDTRQPQCPPEKEAAIMEVLKHFQMV